MSLERWKALRDAIEAWAADRPDPDVARIEDDFFGVFDPVQRSVLTRYFAACRRAIGTAEVDPDPAPARVFSDDGRTILRQAITFILTHPDGDREALRLTLGRPSGGETAAVLALGSDDGVVVADLLADLGHVEPIEVEPKVADRVVADLFGLAAAERDPTPNPGFHCWLCDRTATCGIYRDPWEHGRPPRGTRTIKLSRSSLSRLGTCERRVAWKAVHQVPRPSEDPDPPNTALLVGTAFHRAMESALLDERPDEVVQTHALALPASERADLLMLWDRHSALVASEPHPVAVARTEYPIGLTIPVPDAESAVVVIGQVDAAGREADGTPAVVEHRTGTRAEIPHLEAEMYAVATWQTTGSTRVTVHHHHLRDDEPCVRRVFEEADLHAALDLLADAARTVAGWDPDDSLAPPWSDGPWCASCEFESTCTSWR